MENYPQLPTVVANRLGGKAVRVCSIGFSGRNARELNRELRKSFIHEYFRNIFDGKSPQSILILNGVNDVIDRVGAEEYASTTAALVWYMSPLRATTQVISIPRANEVGFNANSILSNMKRRVKGYVNDSGQAEVNDKYRATLAAAHPEIQIIDFDQFVAFQGSAGIGLAVDGVHLTKQAYGRYGEFLGSQLTLRTD